METYYRDISGESLFAEIKCQVYTMAINKFGKVEFTPSFTDALRSLDEAARLTEGMLHDSQYI